MMLKSPILFTNAYGSHRARTILRRSAPATEVRPAALSEELAPLKEASTSMTAPTTSQRQFGGQERASERGSVDVSERGFLRCYTFLEDEVKNSSNMARDIYKEHFSTGKGVALRSLGRQGLAGLIRFVLAIREEAAAEERDISVRIINQENVKYFGTPFLMIVTPVKGRTELPTEGSPNCVPVTVSLRTDRTRLMSRLASALARVSPGQFLRIDMVGADALYRGLVELRTALEQVSGGGFFAVPELVSMPGRTRVSPQQEHDQQELAQQEQVGVEDAELVQVLRLYVGRSLSQRFTSRTRMEVPAERKRPSDAVASKAQMEELKGVLGSMVQQQKLLTQLMADRQTVVNAQATSPLMTTDVETLTTVPSEAPSH